MSKTKKDMNTVKKQRKRTCASKTARDVRNFTNTGRSFKGILPFNRPKYTKLQDPPFKNLYGVNNYHAWMDGIHRIRLHQFTDVSRKEKAFFILWNGFIVKRANRQLGACQLFPLLMRFIDAHGTELLKRRLVANFVFHCANFGNFAYISNTERAQIMCYAAQKLNAAEFEEKMRREN